MTEWYRLSADEALDQAQSDPQGLTDVEAARRLDEHGPNELIDAGTKSPWRILAEQFTSLLIIILIIAAVASAVLGDYEDAIAIMAIVILNGAAGLPPGIQGGEDHDRAAQAGSPDRAGAARRRGERSAGVGAGAGGHRAARGRKRDPRRRPAAPVGEPSGRRKRL